MSSSIRPSSSTSPSSPRAIEGQRGAAAVTILLLMLSLVAMLGLVEVGYLYWTKRDLQKVADLAALAGAGRLDQCNAANDSNAAALGNARIDNAFDGSLQVSCGHWNPEDPTALDHFYVASASAPVNAVKVIASRPAVPFFGQAFKSNELTLSASAVATNAEPIAAFSIGSSLLELNTDDSALAPLLNSALGTQLGLRLLSSEGIAGAKIKLLDVLPGVLPAGVDLNAATLDDVLDSEISVGDLLDATVGVLAENNELVGVVLDAINTEVARVKAVLGDVTIKLRDILNVSANTSNPRSALDADVGVGDLISVTLQAANREHALDLGTAINLGSLATIALKLAVVEPPKIAIGAPGVTAHTAQTRLKLDLKLLNATNSSDGTIIDLNILGLARITLGAPAGQTLSLPINLELASGTATLEDIRCYQSPNPLTHRVDLSAAPGIANVFVGNLDKAFTNTRSSWSEVVDAAIADGSAFANLLSLKLKVNLLLDIIPVADTTIALRAYANVPANAEANPQSVTFAAIDPETPVSDQHLQADISSNQDILASVSRGLLTPGNITLDEKVIRDLRILGIQANLLSNIVNGLLGALNVLVSWLVGLLGSILTPVFSLLDQLVLGPLLGLLGIDVGNAQVRLLDVRCNGNVRLVY